MHMYVYLSLPVENFRGDLRKKTLMKTQFRCFNNKLLFL